MYALPASTTATGEGHRANGFGADEQLAEYAVNGEAHGPRSRPRACRRRGDAGRHGVNRPCYGLDVMGRASLPASRVGGCLGPGPSRPDGCRRRQGAEGTSPVILTGTREQPARDRAERLRRRPRDRCDEGRCRRGGSSASPTARVCRLRARNARARPMRSMRRRGWWNRGGRICLAAFPAEPVPVDLAYLVRDNLFCVRHPRRGQERHPSRGSACRWPRSASTPS